MKNYNKLLEYYLDSDCYFKSFIPCFFDLFGHFGKCESDEKYFFQSELHRQILEREQAEFGFRITDPQDYIYQYFTMNYTDEQLFSIIFAYWYGLDHKQIQQIADKRRRKLSWHFLNYFLCSTVNDTPTMDLYHFQYGGMYYIWNDNEGEHNAKCVDGLLKEIGSDICYQINQNE